MSIARAYYATAAIPSVKLCIWIIITAASPITSVPAGLWTSGIMIWDALLTQYADKSPSDALRAFTWHDALSRGGFDIRLAQSTRTRSNPAK